MAIFYFSPCLLVSLSLSLRVSVSLCLCGDLRKSFPNHPFIQTILSKARLSARGFHALEIPATSVRDPVFIAISAIRGACVARNGTIIAQCRA